jgi:hypothetical protein
VSPAKLKALANSINKAKHLTYEVVYTTQDGGQSETATIAQRPPKSYFSSASVTVLNTGKKTYYCDAVGGGKTSCILERGANPLVGLESLFSPSVALTAFSEAKGGLLSRELGITSTSSSETIAGQPSTCVTVSIRGHGAKFCVTRQGLLSYSGSEDTSFKMTKFTASPPSSLFALPAGATVSSNTGTTTP